MGLVGAFATAAVAMHPAAGGHCDKLQGRSVVHSHSIKVVAHRFHSIYRAGNTQSSGIRFLGCARPRGLVREIGEIYVEQLYPEGNEVGSGFITFGQTAGDYLLVRDREANFTGDYAERTYQVLNMRTGKGYTYFHYLQDAKPEPAPPSVLKLGANGVLAGIVAQRGADDSGYSEPGAGMAEVVAWKPDGRRVLLDRAPFGAIRWTSLRLAGRTVSWTDGGTARSATV